MENLDRVVAAYKAMDQRAKDEALDYLELKARLYPEHPPLFVILGGRHLDDCRHSSGLTENVPAPTLISAPKQIQQFQLVPANPLKRDNF